MEQRTSGGYPQQPPPQPQPLPAPSSKPAAANTAELEGRVRVLEQRVDRLTDAALRRDSTRQQKGNGFWNVVTFAGWIMVPLIVVYLYHYRKSL